MVEVELRREQVWRSERESGAWLALGWAPGSHWSSIPPLTLTRPRHRRHSYSLTLTDPPCPAPTGVISGAGAM